jgi:hypothetical protein
MINKVSAIYGEWKKWKNKDVWHMVTKNNEWIWFVTPKVLYPTDQFRGWRVKLCFIQDECYTKEINDICIVHMRNVMEGGLTGWIESQIFTLYKS